MCGFCDKRDCEIFNILLTFWEPVDHTIPELFNTESWEGSYTFITQSSFVLVQNYIKIVSFEYTIENREIILFFEGKIPSLELDSYLENMNLRLWDLTDIYPEKVLNEHNIFYIEGKEL